MCIKRKKVLFILVLNFQKILSILRKFHLLTNKISLTINLNKLHSRNALENFRVTIQNITHKITKIN